MNAFALYVHDNLFDERRQKIVRYLTEANGEMLHGKLLKRMHISSEDFAKVINTMIESGEVAVMQNRSGYSIYRLR